MMRVKDVCTDCERQRNKEQLEMKCTCKSTCETLAKSIHKHGEPYGILLGFCSYVP